MDAVKISTYKTQKVDKDIPFDAIDLFASILGHTVHQRAEWYRAYLASHQDIFQPCVLQVENETEDQAIVGVLPLEYYCYKGTRFWKLRRLRPLAFLPSDFANLLFSPGSEADVSRAIAKWFWDNSSSWDECQLVNIPYSSNSWRPLFEALSAQGFVPALVADGKFYKTDTTRDWEDYLAHYLQSRNKDLFKDMRRMDRKGIQLRVVTIRKDIHEYLPQIMPIYAQRRKSLEQTNRYHTSSRIEFFKAALAAYEKQGNVELHLLKDDKDSVWAFQLDWLNNGIRYHYMHAYNEDYGKHSPGKQLLFRLLKESFVSPSIRECNYMLGEAEYKQRLADSSEPYVSLYFENPKSLRLKLTRFAGSIVQLRNKIRSKAVRTK